MVSFTIRRFLISAFKISSTHIWKKWSHAHPFIARTSSQLIRWVGSEGIGGRGTRNKKASNIDNHTFIQCWLLYMFWFYFTQSERANNLIKGTKWEMVGQLRKDIQDFKKSKNLDKVSNRYIIKFIKYTQYNWPLPPTHYVLCTLL